MNANNIKEKHNELETKLKYEATILYDNLIKRLKSNKLAEEVKNKEISSVLPEIFVSNQRITSLKRT